VRRHSWPSFARRQPASCYAAGARGGPASLPPRPSTPSGSYAGHETLGHARFPRRRAGAEALRSAGRGGRRPRRRAEELRRSENASHSWERHAGAIARNRIPQGSGELEVSLAEPEDVTVSDPFEHFHLAMAARWHDGGPSSHAEEYTVESSPRWGLRLHRVRGGAVCARRKKDGTLGRPSRHCAGSTPSNRLSNTPTPRWARQPGSKEEEAA
jgi:hypothetical protein